MKVWFTKTILFLSVIIITKKLLLLNYFTSWRYKKDTTKSKTVFYVMDIHLNNICKIINIKKSKSKSFKLTIANL